MVDEALTGKLVSSSNVYEGRVCNLRKDLVKLPDGRLTYREVVDHPGPSL